MPYACNPLVLLGLRGIRAAVFRFDLPKWLARMREDADRMHYPFHFPISLNP